MHNISKAIKVIKDVQGTWILEQNDIINEFRDHFYRTFIGKHTMQGVDHIYLKRIPKPQAADWLQRPFEEEEILQSLKLCGNNKAPGPDGFTVKFFLNNGEYVKHDVIKAVKNFFRSGKNS